MEPNFPQDTNPESDAIEKASRQLFRGDGLDFAHLARPPDNAVSDEQDVSQLTNDDIYDFIQENRDRTFDHTTDEGKLLFLRFKEANARRNEFSMSQFKEMAKRVAAVPADIVKGVFNNPLKVPASLADGMARDALDLYGVLAESEDPSSPLFRFKNYIWGTGTVEDQIKQFNEARWWNNRSNELEEGKDTVLEHWVPDNYREFARSLIDPKLANALSYIGLDAPQFIKGAFRRGGIRASAEILKGGLSDHHVLNAQRAAETSDWFQTSAAKFRELSQRMTGETLQAVGGVASAPFEYIREKVLRGSQEIESKLGYVPPEVSNGASTLMADLGSSVTKGGVEMSPIKSILFSLGVKPIAEYASVVGSELVDAANGVVKIKSEHTGLGMMNRLALNGGRIALSGEAQAVAKFANVVVGWPASMAFPAFKRAVGDSAYMGVLGYLNARGEGASSGFGMGFAWGGFSGAVRHIHNVYNQSVAHDYVISNFDKGQLLEIEKKSPDHAQNIREYLANVDASGDKRVMATVRAEIMAGWVSDYETQLRYKDVSGLVSEYGEQAIKHALGNDLEVAATRRGGSMVIDGKNVIWVNRNAPPEALGHEFGHRFLDILLSKTDGSAQDAVKSFLGDDTDKGVVPDSVLAMFIGHYSMMLAGYNAEWLNSPNPSYIPASAKNPNKKGGTMDTAYGNIAYAKDEIRKFRELLKTDPAAISRYVYVNGVPRLEIFDQFPIIEKLMHETFAYSHSNNMLVRSPDFFLRNPNMKSIRHVMENWQMLNNQRLVSNLEAAGYVLREAKNSNGETVLQSLFWDDGKYVSMPMLDKWGEEVMKRVLRNSDVHVSTMSPDRAVAFAKQTHKERFTKGGKFMTKKEVEETITATADAIAATLDALPDQFKPKWTIAKGGSKKVKLTELTKEAWNAIEASNVYHPEEFKVLVGMVDVLKQIEAGKPVFNTFTAQYLGWSKQVMEAALGERLKGRQVPVTFRHFAPFDIELTVSKFDEFGNPLANPRSHITIHAHDVNVLNRRKMNQWQKPEVRSLFKDFGHFSETFVSWFSQLSEDPSTRKPSADYLRPEFGKDAERVRDIMYETWGGRKRNDETYINIPEGYAGGKDGPDYPIHSLRFDLMANVLKQSQIFPEAFQGQVMGLYHRHGIAYEPMRRNMMLGNFVQRELTNGRRFYTDANGFEIRGEIPKLKLFNMYGNLVGVYKTMESAQKAAERALKKLPVEELMPTKSDMGDSIGTSEPILEYDHGAVGAISGSSNLMIANGRRVPVEVDQNSPLVKAFSLKAQQYMRDFRDGVKSSKVEDLPVIKVTDLIKSPKDLIEAFPEVANLSVTVNPYAADHGGSVVGMGGGTQMGTIAQITPDAIATHGDMVTFATELAAGLQELSALKEGFSFALRVPYVASELRLTPELKAHQKVGELLDEATLQFGGKPTPEQFKEFLTEKVKGYVQEVVKNWIGTPTGRYPSWVDLRKTFAGTNEVRFSQSAWDILYEFAGYNIPQQVAIDLNDHFCKVRESIEAGKAFVVQTVDGGVVISDGDSFKLPESVERFFNSNHMDMRTNPPTPEPDYFWERYSRKVKELALTHFISKDGDRGNYGTPAQREVIRRENISASSFGVNPYVLKTYNGQPFEFGSRYPDVPRQASNIFDAVSEGKTFVLHVEAGIPRRGGGSEVLTISTFNTLSIMKSGGKGGQWGNEPMKNTTTPMLAHNHPMRGMLGGDNPVFDLSTEMALTRTSPFVANGKKGELHKLYASGWHLGVLSKLSSKIGVPFDVSKDGNYVGLANYVKALSSSGVDTPEKLVALRWARGSLLAEQARHILSGDGNGLYQKFVNAEPSFNTRFSPMDYAMVLANRGYALMSHSVASATLGNTRRKGNKRHRFGSSILESSFADPEGAPKLSSRFLKVAFESMDTLEANGYRPAKMKRGQTNVGIANSMLGGFTNSTAKEREMLETGAMRLVKTDSGKTYKAFEFSDKDATLLLEKVGGKMHLVPFMEDGEKGFETFIRNTEMGLNAVFMDTNSVKLGDILDHRLLYLHYPSLKNVAVQWKEGYGADYNPDSDVIRLGVDMFIGDEMSSRRNAEYRTHADFGHEGQRHATETILHEIQHAIQMREMWTDSYALIAGPQAVGGPIMTANVSGIAGRTIAESGRGKSVNEAGTLIYSDDPTRAPTNFSDAETLRSIYRLGNTPMHKHLRQIAYPAFLRVSNEAINALTDAHLHHPPQHPARRNAESAVKSLVAMREEAKVLADDFKQGTISEEEFRSRMCDLDNGLAPRFFRRVTQVRNSMFLDKSVLGYKLYDSLDNAEKYLHRSIEALDGYEFISKMAERDGLNGDVTLASVKLKQVFGSLAGMHYLSQRHEIEASLTEKRSRMTQEELNSTGLNPDGSRKTLLDSVAGAMDIGYKGNTLRNIGIALRNKQRVRVADLMIGGVASKDPSYNVRNKDVISLLARTSLITWTIRQLKNELDALDRVAMIGRGWEVAEDGSVKLVAKTATIQLNSKNPRRGFTQMGEDIKSALPTSPDTGSGPIFTLDDADRVHITNAIWGSGERTVTMEDIARIIDGIVLNEWEVRTPTEAMDAVLRDDFPSLISVSDIESTLRRMGVSDDGIAMANINSFIGKDGRMTSAQYDSLQLTKYELANILAVFHKQYVNERIVATTEGAKKFGPVSVNREIISPEKVIEAIVGTKKEESDPLRSFIYERTGQMFELAEAETSTIRSEPNAPRIGLSGSDLNEDIRKNTAQLSPFAKPEWMSNEDYDTIMSRLSAKGYFKEGSLFYAAALKNTTQSERNASAAQNMAIETNRRIRRKMFLIKPFYESIVSKIESGDDSITRRIKVKLLDDISKALIEPELEGMREYTSSSSLVNTGGITLGGSSSEYSGDFSKGPSARFGMTLALVGNGADLSGGTGFIELQTLQTAVGFTFPHIRFEHHYLTDVEDMRPYADPNSYDEGVIRYKIKNNAFEAERGALRTFEHLLDIVNVTKNLHGVTKEILDDAESYWDNDADLNKLNKIRLLADLAGRLELLEGTTTSLIGDNKESNSDQPSRNVIVGQSYIDGMAPRVAQESFLMKGYSGADGSVVLGETKLANAVSSVQLNGQISMPFFDGSGLPSMAANPKFTTSTISGLLARDKALRTVLFGQITDANEVQTPLNYIAPISDFVRGFRVPTTTSVVLDAVSPNEVASVKNTLNGLHALHSIVYVATARSGRASAINGALGASKEFYETWGMNWPNLREGVTHIGEISAASYVPAMAPLIAAALSPKQIGVRKGKMTVIDHLLPEQRQLLKNAREAYRNFSMDMGLIATPEQKAAADAFFQSISEDQHRLMFGHLDTANSEITFAALCGAYEAMAMIPKLPEAPALDALFGRSVKEVMTEEIGRYLSEGRYMYEKGNSEGPMARHRFATGNVGFQWMQSMYKSVMKDELNRHMLMAVWSLMDQHASGYKAVMHEGNNQKQNYPLYFRGSERETFLRVIGDKPYSSIDALYSKKMFAALGHDRVISNDNNDASTMIDPVHSLSEWYGPDQRYDYHVLEGTGTGLAESLFEPIDPAKTSPEFVVELEQVEQAPDAVVGASKIDVAVRGSPISAKLTRKQMVDSIVRQARRAKTDAISIEPARMRLSGRLISSSIQRGFESSTAGSREGVPFRGHAFGVSNNLFGPFTLFPKSETGQHVTQNMAPPRVALTEPMRGFAWKRLEDGSIVINISGDITGYKAGYLGNQMRFDSPDRVKRLPVGFSIRESLGYDPRSGEISNANPYITLFGSQTARLGGGGAAGLQNYFRIGGEPWRKQIVAAARNRLKYGDPIRASYEGISANREGIRNVNSYINFDAYETLMASDSAHNDADVIALALAINGHKTGAQHITLTFSPEEANPDMIKAVLMAVMVQGQGSEIMNSVWNTTYERQGSEMNPFLGDGEKIMELLRFTAGASYLDGIGTRIGQVMGERLRRTNMKDMTSINELLAPAANQTITDAGRSVDETRAFFGKYSNQTISRSQDVIPDIERIAAAAVGADHGYILPDAERHLAKNGDLAVAIQHMFPNRPELAQFAWDGKESNGVSIVHRGPKTKPTGYFVTYDIQTGVNNNGEPIYSRKVVPVKTLVEAEALRNKFGASASKAILAQALVSAGAGEASVKDGVMSENDNVDVSVKANKHLESSERQRGNMTLVNDGTFTVGDLDLNVTKAEATALSAVLGSRSVLQAKIPSVEVGRANLMIGDSNARELEGMLRRKLNFGFGQGPIEFVSKMMRVVAYGRKKSGRDKYPDSMTGLDWFKFLKENAVSKDEIRMSGIAFLLHENADVHLTRKDLAEFIYTVYPRTSRQARTSQRDIGPEVNKVKVGSLSGVYDMPYLEDIQTKEDFVIKTHLRNLESVAELIENSLGDETKKADAEALKNAIMKSIGFTVAEMGAPNGLEGITDLTMAVNYLRNLYDEGLAKTVYSHAGHTGEFRKVRPAILEYVMADSIFGRTSDQYKTIETAIGDLGLINPYSIAYADTSSPSNPFSTMSSAGMRSPVATSLNSGVGPMSTKYDSSSGASFPLFQGQNFYYHGGNYHASWASFTGYYQSNPLFTEFSNQRIKKEKDTAIKVLQERIAGTTDPAAKAKYESIISNINRVYTVRELIKGSHSLADFGHYSENDTGTFQIGHVRSTQTVLSGEYGFGDPKTPNYHAEEQIYGYMYDPEIVLAIEEIQSDSFQYHSFGPPSATEKALPDSLEQVEGFKRAGDMQKLIESREKLNNIMASVGNLIGNHVQRMSYYGFGDVELNALYGIKLLGMLSPVERYLLRTDLGLKDSGRTVEVPEGLRKFTDNLSRIPVYEFPDISLYKDREHVSRHEGYNFESSQRVLNDLLYAAGQSVLLQLLPQSVLSNDIKGAFEGLSSGSYSGAARALTPSLIFGLSALADEELISKSIEIEKAEKDILPYKGIDWDALARRTLDKLKTRRDEIINTDNNSIPTTKYAKIKFFDMLMDSYEEWLSSPQNRSTAILHNSDKFREWEWTGGDEYTDFQKHVVAYSGQFKVVSPPHGYKTGIGGRIFPSVNVAEKDVLFHHGALPSGAAGTRTYEIGNPVFEKMAKNHYLQYRVGATALGNLVANSIQPLIALMSSAADAPERLKQIEKDISELAKIIPVMPSGRDPAILNSLPFGVEDVYKPISLNGTVIRAANAGLSAITYADARHQVNRGHSMDTASAMLVGRQSHIMYMGQDNPKAYMLSYLNMLPDWLTYQLHGGFMDRMAKFGPEEFMGYFRNRQAFEHNGVNAPYNVHLLLTLRDAVPHLFTEGISIDDIPSDGGLRDIWKALAGNNVESIKDELIFSDSAFKEDSSLIGPDGKPLKPRDLSTNFMQKFYGKQVVGEKKSGNQRAIDNGIANIGRYHFWFERGDAMGYVSQYGAPSWFMESIMWGQSKKNLQKFATDAFIRPNAVLRDDGTYSIINPKTGQVIMEKIKNPLLLKEAMLQNSEYVGSLPYIGQFVKQWGPVGGYVTLGHSNGNVTGSDNVEWSRHFGFEEGKLDPLGVQHRRSAYRKEAPHLLGNPATGTGGNTFGNSPTKPMSPTGYLSTQLGYKVWFKHVMKVDVTDPVAVSNALTTIATSGGPVLRFKPKFPNEAHKAAFRKKIVEGIALLMPSDGGLGKPKADTATLEALSRMYKWFSKATMGRRIPTEGEALEDDDEYAR